METFNIEMKQGEKALGRLRELVQTGWDLGLIIFPVLVETISFHIPFVSLKSLTRGQVELIRHRSQENSLEPV